MINLTDLDIALGISLKYRGRFRFGAATGILPRTGEVALRAYIDTLKVCERNSGTSSLGQTEAFV